jgi:hypothetical protein
MKFLIYIIITFGLVISVSDIYSQSSAKIYNKDFPTLDTINLGLCMLDSTLRTTFILSNTGNTTLEIGNNIGNTPSYTITKPYILYPSIDFLQFQPSIPLLFNYTILPYITIKDTLTYTADPNDTSSINKPMGKNMAKLILGLYDPKDLTKFVALDSFIVIAYKTKQYLDCYENRIVFDSVYINPLDTMRFYWAVQNASSFFLQIYSQNLTILTPIPLDTEISVNKYLKPVPFPANRTTKDWQIKYYPKDTKPDSAIFQLAFKPDPVNYPDSLNFISVTIVGCGVEQKIDLIDATVNYHNDTLDLGDVRLGSSKEAEFYIQNNGNIPFGILSQQIESDQAESSFSITKQLAINGLNIQPQAKDTVKIKFTPINQVPLLARYVIESDILTRRIQGTPKQNQFRTFYLKARGVEAKIALAKETVDFGNIVIHQDCPTNRDTSIFIANNGNIDLIIKEIQLQPPHPYPFTVTLDSVNQNILPNSRRLLRITFSTQSQVDTQFNATLTIISNSTPPLDTIRFHLSARGIKPLLTDISIPKIASKPGRRISVPIIAEKNKLVYAKTFITTLQFDSTMLDFIDKEIINTASENADTIKIVDTVSGKLFIEIRMPAAANSHFLPSDTIILLKFNTYLGDKISTPIAFGDIAFGDGVCSNVLNSNPQNGSLTIDSVCGLEYIAIPLTQKKYSFEKLFPNPAEDKLEIEYSIPINLKVEISIYNSFGNELSRPVNNVLPVGDYKLTIPISDLAPGLYYCEIRSGLFKKTLPFIVNK